MPDREEVQECLCSDFASAVDGKSIDQAVAFLEALKREAQRRGEFRRFKLVTEDEGEYDYCQTFLRVYGTRLETQEEYDKRLLKHEEKKVRALARACVKREKLRQQLSALDAEIEKKKEN